MNYLSEQYEVIDIDAIDYVRLFVRQTLARALESELLEVYQANHVSKPYAFNAADMAQRSLKNTCLSYLMELEKAEYTNLCVKQFAADENMTDVMASLGALVHHAGTERETALQQFYVKWQHDPQVVEKWLALQAGSRLPDTLAHVKSLLEHPAFSLKNPNKVRSLIGRFCQTNPRFHASNGEGYRFLSEHVLKLDKLNPQIAARLVQALARWKRYDEKRRQLMQVELQGILSHSDLSKDVYEVVGKMLGQEG